MRIGIGYDIHKLVKGRKLIIGGIEIPSDKGLLGHSDADVLLHAISDAVLGALALGDIGKHFPDTAPEFKDVDSRKLLRKTIGIIKESCYRVSNIDSTVIVESPKLATHIEQMRKKIAEDTELDIEDVSIKATTNEGLGSIGKGEAIAAQAIVLLDEL